MSHPSIAIFARAPLTGQAKTRLIPRLGPEGAAQFQAALIRRAVRTALDACLGPVSLWCAPDCSHPAFTASQAQFGVRLYPQAGVDLGTRMFNAFVALCGTGDTLLIGTDCPALTATVLRDAARALHVGRDAAFVAAEDGGYVLVGLRRPVASLFHAMPWGTGRVMAETRERLRHAGLRWRELTPSWDVDRPEDFERLLASGCMPELANG